MSSNTLDEIKHHWDQEALRSGAKIGSHSDPNLVDLENWFVIEKCLKRFQPKLLLDIGCGNGQRTRLLSEHVAGNVVGIDYSRNMINNARSLENEKLTFHVANILEKKSHAKLGAPFDCVVSFRCLINLGNIENQIKSISYVSQLLKTGGVFAFCEASQQGTEKLNSLRARVGLKPIIPIAVNLDLDESAIRNHLEKEFLIVEKRTFAVYYLLTRVYYPAVISPEEPNPLSKFNALAARLSMEIDNDTPPVEGRHLCMVCVKKTSH